MARKPSKKKRQRKDAETSKKQHKIYAITFLFILSSVYILYFINLHFFYDWDAIDLAIQLKESKELEYLNPKHLIIPLLVKLVLPFFEPLTAIKFLTGIFAFLLIAGIFQFSYHETKEITLAFLLSIFVLFNFGITFLITSLEDNIWANAFIILFIYYLLRERWEISALFLSLAILIHIQSAVFLIMLVLYIYLKYKQMNKTEDNKYSSHKNYIKIFICLSAPLAFAYGFLMLFKGLSIYELIITLTASDYRANPDWWFFSSNRSLAEQLILVHYGITSTFVCRFPEFTQIMPQATLFSAIILIVLLGVLLKFFRFNIKTLCAIPPFLILLINSIFYESYNIERWDFLPLFFVYFVTTSYPSIKNEIGLRRTEILKVTITLLTFIGLSFTLSSFYLISGFASNPIYDYADKLSTDILTKDDRVLESIRKTSELGLYIKYKLNDKVIFIDKDDLISFESLTNFNNLYCSYYTYYLILKDISVKADLVWLNEKNQAFSIMKIRLSQ